jgi:hypothetical protein
MKGLNTNLFRAILMAVMLVVGSQYILAQKRSERFHDRMKHADVLYLTPEQEDEVMAYLRENYADRLDELNELKKKRDILYKRKMSQAYREMRFMKDLKERDEERYKRVADEKKLEKQIRLMVESYLKSSNPLKKEELRTGIRKLLNKIFDYRQMNRQEEIAKLEMKLNELKEINEQRIANKDAIVENRLIDLLGQKPELEW